MTTVTRKQTKAVARFALVFWFPAALLVAWIVTSTGCASSSFSSSSAARGDAPAEAFADAVLPAGDGWRIFQLGTQRHAKVPGNPEAWAGGTPAVTPASSSSENPAASRSAGSTWLKLAAPSGAFRPVQVVPAQRGYFLIVDAASSRLCLYDMNAGLLSTFPLPEAFTPFPAGRAAVFRGADGAFTFVDYAAGEAWQFADRQTSGAGTTQWVSRGRSKLPAGARGCMQPPGSEELFCRGADGSPLRFDGALNRVPAHRAFARDAREAGHGPGGTGVAAAWDAAAGEWVLEGLSAGGAPLFRYLPAHRRWLGAPDSAARLDPLSSPLPSSESIQTP